MTNVIPVIEVVLKSYFQEAKLADGSQEGQNRSKFEAKRIKQQYRGLNPYQVECLLAQNVSQVLSALSWGSNFGTWVRIELGKSAYEVVVEWHEIQKAG